MSTLSNMTSGTFSFQMLIAKSNLMINSKFSLLFYLRVLHHPRNCICVLENIPNVYLIIMVGSKEYWYEGQPYNAGGVHCEPDIPANKISHFSRFLKLCKGSHFLNASSSTLYHCRWMGGLQFQTSVASRLASLFCQSLTIMMMFKTLISTKPKS